MASVTTKSARSLTARSPKRARAQVTLTTQATVGDLIDIPGMDLDALVLTQRLFPNVSELQLWEDGVSTISRRRDAVDVAVREAARRQFRDGVVPRRTKTTWST